MNEIIQYCDYKGLQEMIFNLGKAIIEKIVEQMGHFQSGPQGADLEQVEFLMNNYCGMLGVIIIRLEDAAINLKDQVYSVLPQLCAQSSFRVGVLLVLNGLLNALQPH